MVDVIIGLVFFLFPVMLGLFGGYRERSHIAQLDRREQEFSHILITQVKSFPSATSGETPPHLFVAEAVIGTDYLKTFFAKLRNIFGGEVRSFQSLMIRARRESLLRILAQADRGGYNALCNVRFETADVGGNTGVKRKMPMASILASATAYHADTRGPWMT